MKIYFVTNSENFYGQKKYPWESLDIRKIITKLENLYQVEHVCFDQIVNSDINIENSIVIYSSSQQKEYKEYIEDILMYLMQKGNRLVPSINIFKSHENKGYQELHKKLIGISSIPAYYFGHYKEIEGNDIKFPSVLKALDGFGSGNVSLVNSKIEVVKLTSQKDCIIDKSLFKTIRTIIAKPIKRYILHKKVIEFNSKDFFHFFKRFIIQDFKPNLTYDYKVLVLYDKYYVLKRYTKKNDFRASGSGNFVFEEVENTLLDYAYKVFNKFNEPMMSLDICFDGNEFYLIEFQGIHFGPFTLTNSEGYYIKEKLNWIFVYTKSEIDHEVSNALYSYIKAIK
jgi:glutathione synthase/RimK-type ligase-like ATP-grasp enzyme